MKGINSITSTLANRKLIYVIYLLLVLLAILQFSPVSFKSMATSGVRETIEDRIALMKANGVDVQYDNLDFELFTGQAEFTNIMASINNADTIFHANSITVSNFKQKNNTPIAYKVEIKNGFVNLNSNNPEIQDFKYFLIKSGIQDPLKLDFDLLSEAEYDPVSEIYSDNSFIDIKKLGKFNSKLTIGRINFDTWKTFQNFSNIGYGYYDQSNNEESLINSIEEINPTLNSLSWDWELIDQIADYAGNQIQPLVNLFGGSNAVKQRINSDNTIAKPLKTSLMNLADFVLYPKHLNLSLHPDLPIYFTEITNAQSQDEIFNLISRLNFKIE